MRQIERRDFLKYAGGLVGVTLLGQYTRLSLTRENAGASGAVNPVESKAVRAKMRAADGLGTDIDPGKKFGLAIDVGACIGCRRCMWACKEENNIPDTITPLWIEVFRMEDSAGLTGHPSMEDLLNGSTTSYEKSPEEGHWYMPAQCNHCDNPPCVKVCPVGATYKDKDGLVLMDYDRCIGCRFCVVACPYSARRFNWSNPSVAADKVNPLVPLRPVGVVEKCTFCVHRTRQGKLPRCVEVCPVGARHFGDLNNPDSEVSRILKANPGFRLLEEVNTKPNIWYITRGKKYTR
ncbi:MAG: 4Fe-4S dicluster domain-containing protein [Chloroflexi bacterium]|nr:4Fe-4S dicluster domain-containing protein [Chloroflexota bacterium]